MLPATESSRGAGQSRQRPCGVTAAWPLSWGQLSCRLALARNQPLHVDLNPKGRSPGWSARPPNSPARLRDGWRFQFGENTSWLNPANRKSTRERISFGSKRVGPKVVKLNFGTWPNRSCATRTKVRRHAPLTRCNAVERPTATPAHCRDDHRHPNLRPTGVLKWQEQTIWKARRTGAASMAARRACRSRRTEAQRSRASFATRGDKNSRRTKRVLNTSAGKIGAMIRLVIRSSDSRFNAK
jgi:hypothetical protein